VLEQDYRRGTTEVLRRRSHIVLLAAEMGTQAEVARAVRCSLDTVQRALALWGKGGLSALRPRPVRRVYPGQRTLAWQKALAEAMERGPEACGVKRPTWTRPLLAKYLTEQTGLATSARRVGLGLASLDYRLGRPTWTVRHKAEEQEDYLPKSKGSRRS
jgi:transposase